MICNVTLADTHYVSMTGGFTGPFTNWAGSARTIQSGINAAREGDTVLVDDGLYIENVTMLNYAVTLISVNGASQTTIHAYTPANASILSGPCVTISKPGYVDGFTLTGGGKSATGRYDPDSAGGAYIIQYGTIQNCIITANSVGGVLLDGGGTVNNCIISGSSEALAAVYINGEGSVINSIVRDNDCTGIYCNGGLYSSGGSVRNCTVSGNTGSYGSGLHLYKGGLVENCRVYNNIGAAYGSAIWLSYGGTVRSSLIYANTNASYAGGGAYMDHGGIIENSTLWNNVGSTIYDGVYCSGGGEVRNSIVQQINTNGSAVITYSCIPTVVSGTGNISNAPQFVNAATRDYHLTNSSPCINAGINQGWMTTASDIDGNARILGSAVDMGAYERSGIPTAPASISASDGTYSNKINLTWSAVSGAAGYSVWRNIINNSDSATSIASGLTSANYDDTSVIVETSYYYWVKASNASGTSDFSVVDLGYAHLPAPSAPIGLSASYGSFTNKITVTWGAVASATGYGVWRGTTNNSVTASLVGTSSGTAFDDSSVSRGALYYYWVKATNYSGASSFSPSACGFAATPSFPGVHYVVQVNAGASYPYTNWAIAATNIQDAIRSANIGESVLVFDGIYSRGGGVMYGAMTNRIVVTNGITVQSVNGPAVTIIKGNGPCGSGAVRCAYVGKNCYLNGFTLTNGATLTSGDAFNELMGGGVWCDGGGQISNCVISGNAANLRGGGVKDGAFYNCTISGNSAFEGCGAYCSTLYNCTLNNNSGGYGGGAEFGTMYNCIVSNNSVTYNGGGGYNETMYNCLVIGNSAGNGGGAYAGSLYNCTVYNNTAGTAGGGVYGGSSLFVNSIVYSNHAPSGLNWSGGIFSNCCTTPIPGSGARNITTTPLFINASLGNYHLQSNSLCIDTGINKADIISDLEGTPRPLDGKNTGNAIMDMGCYEYVNLLSDSDRDGLNDGDEAIAGTSPIQAQDSFRMDAISGNENNIGVLLLWRGVTGRVYGIEWRTNLMTGSWMDLPGYTNIPGSGANLGITNAGNDVTRFYRAKVWLKP